MISNQRREEIRNAIGTLDDLRKMIMEAHGKIEQLLLSGNYDRVEGHLRYTGAMREMSDLVNCADAIDAALHKIGEACTALTELT